VLLLLLFLLWKNSLESVLIKDSFDTRKKKLLLEDNKG
jgi:hypothetical protein